MRFALTLENTHFFNTKAGKNNTAPSRLIKNYLYQIICDKYPDFRLKSFQ